MNIEERKKLRTPVGILMILRSTLPLIVMVWTSVWIGNHSIMAELDQRSGFLVFLTTALIITCVVLAIVWAIAFIRKETWITAIYVLAIIDVVFLSIDFLALFFLSGYGSVFTQMNGGILWLIDAISLGMMVTVIVLVSKVKKLRAMDEELVGEEEVEKEVKKTAPSKTTTTKTTSVSKAAPKSKAAPSKTTTTVEVEEVYEGPFKMNGKGLTAFILIMVSLGLSGIPVIIFGFAALFNFMDWGWDMDTGVDMVLTLVGMIRLTLWIAMMGISIVYLRTGNYKEILFTLCIMMIPFALITFGFLTVILLTIAVPFVLKGKCVVRD